MGIRQSIEKNKHIATIAAFVLLLAGAGTIAYQLTGKDAGQTGNAYFSNDDGKTFFTGDIATISPFTHDGKVAYQAHVFEVGGKRVVGYMTRYTERALQAIQIASDAKRAGRPVPNISEMAQIGMTGVEYKKPGSASWVRDPQQVNKIRVYHASDGTVPAEVFP